MRILIITLAFALLAGCQRHSTALTPTELRAEADALFSSDPDRHVGALQRVGKVSVPYVVEAIERHQSSPGGAGPAYKVLHSFGNAGCKRLYEEAIKDDRSLIAMNMFLFGEDAARLCFRDIPSQDPKRQAAAVRILGWVTHVYHGKKGDPDVIKEIGSKCLWLIHEPSQAGHRQALYAFANVAGEFATDIERALKIGDEKERIMLLGAIELSRDNRLRSVAKPRLASRSATERKTARDAYQACS